MQEFGISEESWAVVVPETEKDRLEEEAKGPVLQNSVMNAFDSSLQRCAGQMDSNSTPFEYEVLTDKLLTFEWIELILSLNEKQHSLHQYVVEWAIKMTLTHQIKKPDPFYVFLTGGAGVKKSHVVKAIGQAVNRIFAVNRQTNVNHVLVCAPTGSAAYNMVIHATHASFLLPLHTRKADDYIPLSSEKLAIMKETFSDINLISIDEISMVGADTLLTIHRRLCDIMSNTLPFGGISILADGDLLPRSQFLQNLQMKCLQYMGLYGKTISKSLNLQRFSAKKMTADSHPY